MNAIREISNETVLSDNEIKIVSAVALDVLKVLGACAKAAPPGCLVEVGVWKGGSAYVLGMVAEEQERELYLYDTFTGMPYAGADDAHKVGDFSDTSREAVAALIPHAWVIEGVFPQSAMSRMRDIAFVHIDCDQYQAIKESVEYLTPLMVPGGLMWFDDYKCLVSATRAIDELFAGRIVMVAGKAVVEF